MKRGLDSCTESEDAGEESNGGFLEQREEEHKLGAAELSVNPGGGGGSPPLDQLVADQHLSVERDCWR